MVHNATNGTAVLVDETNLALSIVNPLLIKIVIAILIFLIGFVIGKIVQKIILKFFEMSDLDRPFRKHTGIKVPLSKIVSSIVSYFIYVVAVVMALNRLEIATTIITTVVLLLVIILVLFIIFGLNDVFANLISGIVVKIRGNVKQGDYIRIKDKRIEGYVVSIDALSVRLETLKDETVLVPNMVLFRSEIVKPKNMRKKK